MNIDTKIRWIIKNDKVQPFDPDRIADAVGHAATRFGYNRQDAEQMTAQIIYNMEKVLDPNSSLYRLKGFVDPMEIELSNFAEREMKGKQDRIDKKMLEEVVVWTLCNIDHNVGHSYGTYMRSNRRRKEGNLPGELVTNGTRRDLLRKTIEWYEENGVTTIADLSKKMSDPNKLKELILSSNQRYENEIEEAALIVLHRLEQAPEGRKLIVVSGPSSSNKTTSTTKILNYLSGKLGELDVVEFPGDDYFKGLDKYAEIEVPLIGSDGQVLTNIVSSGDWIFKTHNYETPFALEFDAMNDALRKLICLGSAMVPNYNFNIGKRDGKKEVTCSEGGLVILDSLHGMYPPFLEDIDPRNIITIYTENISYLHDDDGNKIPDSAARLARRIIRDMQNRGKHPWDTMGHWGTQDRGVQYIQSKAEYAHCGVNGGNVGDIPICNSYTRDLLRNPNSLFRFWEIKVDQGNLPVEKFEQRKRDVLYFLEHGPDFMDDFMPTGKHLAHTPELAASFQICKAMMEVDQRTRYARKQEYEKIIPKDAGIREFIGGSTLKVTHQ